MTVSSSTFPTLVFAALAASLGWSVQSAAPLLMSETFGATSTTGTPGTSPSTPSSRVRFTLPDRSNAVGMILHTAATFFDRGRLLMICAGLGGGGGDGAGAGEDAPWPPGCPDTAGDVIAGAARGPWPTITLRNHIQNVTRPWRRPPGLAGQRAGSYIVIGEPRQVHACLRALRYDHTWNNTARSLVHLLVHSQADREEQQASVAAVVRFFWSSFVHNVVVSVESDSSCLLAGSPGNPLAVFSYHPFADGACGRNITDLPQVNVWAGGEFEQSESLLFPDKAPKTWKGCTVISSSSPMDGYRIEDRAMRTIFQETARRANFSIEFRTNNDPTFSTDALWHGPFREVFDGNADVALNYFWATVNRHRSFTPTATVDMENLEVFVTSSKERSFLDPQLIGVLTATFVFLCVAHYGFALACRRVSGHRGPDFLGAATSVWSLHMDVPRVALSRLTSQRLLWAAFSFYVIPINTTVRCLIAADAMNPRYFHLDDVGELARAGVPLGVESKVVFTELDASRRDATADSSLHGLELEDCDRFTLPQCIDKFVRSRGRYAFNIRRNVLLREVPQMRGRVWTLRRPLKVAPVSLFLTKGHPLSVEFDRVIERLQSGGFLDLWFDPDPEPMVEDRPRPLRVRDVLDALKMLVGGLAGAAACFAWEVATSQSHRRVWAFSYISSIRWLKLKYRYLLLRANPRLIIDTRMRRDGDGIVRVS